MIVMYISLKKDLEDEVSKFKALFLSIWFNDLVCAFVCVTTFYLKIHVPLLTVNKLYVCVYVYVKF